MNKVGRDTVREYKKCVKKISVAGSNKIKGRDVQRKNVVNNLDKSGVWAPLQNGPYKNTQNITKHDKTKLKQVFNTN